jgi:hypothetical protein
LRRASLINVTYDWRQPEGEAGYTLTEDGMGADSVPATTVDSGAVVTIDTVSHEGILAAQGRDPDASSRPTASRARRS